MDTKANRFPKGVFGSYGGIVSADDTDIGVRKLSNTDGNLEAKVNYLYCNIIHEAVKAIAKNNVKLSNDLDIDTREAIAMIKITIQTVEDPNSSDTDKDIIKNATIMSLSYIFDTLVIRSTSNYSMALYNDIKETITNAVGGYFDGN